VTFLFYLIQFLFHKTEEEPQYDLKVEMFISHRSVSKKLSTDTQL